jgi:alpha-aminoadipate carrier protein LysW
MIITISSMVIIIVQISFDKSTALPYHGPFKFTPCGAINNLGASAPQWNAAISQRQTWEVQTMAECPVCGADITLAVDAEEGEIIACDDCGSELEVTGKDSLREAPQEEEDWGE